MDLSAITSVALDVISIPNTILEEEEKVKKKIAAVAAGFLAISLAGQSASAKSLEDVLKEKGVITEEDYKEVTKIKPFDYQLGKGFIFTSPDEKYQLTFGGRLQFRYTFTDFDVKQDTSQWDAKRIRLIAQGYAYSKDLTYKLEFDPRAYASDTRKGLIETFFNYKIIDEAQIKVGQMKTPFTRQELISDGQLQFVDRSIVVDAFKPTYDIGAMLNGKIAGGLAYYYAGVYGGAGQTSTRSSNDNMLVARVVVNPLGDMTNFEADLDRSAKPLLSIGANYFMNTLNKSTPATGVTLDNNISNYSASSGWLGKGFNKAGYSAANDKLDVDSYGADLAFKWMGASLQGEYMLGQAEAQSNGHLLRAHGFYAQAGYMILSKLEVALRYSYFDPDRDVANDHIIETIGAVSYYFNKHNLKLQADAGNIHTQTSTKPTDDMQFRVQAQIIF
jgi:phosphate-selective porin OprO/OprP